MYPTYELHDNSSPTTACCCYSHCFFYLIRGRSTPTNVSLHIHSLQYCTLYGVVIAINAYHIGQAPLLFLKGGRASTPTKHQVSLPCRRGIRAVKDLARQRHGEKTNKGKKKGPLLCAHTKKILGFRHIFRKPYLLDSSISSS